MRQKGPYNATVLDHHRHPRNVGVLAPADADVTVSNAECGDTIRLTLSIREGRIEAAQFKASGCVVAIAAASCMTELLTGTLIEDAARLRNETVARALGGLPAARIRCSVLVEEAISAALEAHLNGSGTASPRN